MYMCAYIQVCILAWACAGSITHGRESVWVPKDKLMPGSSGASQLAYWDRCFHWGSLGRLGCLAYKPRNLLVFASPVLALQVCTPMSGCLCGFWGSHSVLHVVQQAHHWLHSLCGPHKFLPSRTDLHQPTLTEGMAPHSSGAPIYLPQP